MSSAILANYNPPTLSYRGAVDITSAQYGSTLYNLFYDASLVALGSVLMFEVKTIEENILIPNPDNVTLSFISIENATNTGISNQWQIAVPSLNDAYDPSTSVKIAIRVYIGLTGTAEVGVTEWSNELDVHNPPARPVIAIDGAFYNTPGDEDELYIFLDPSNNSYVTSDYTNLKFVAAFYYQDASDATVWDVSVPTSAELVTGGMYMIHVPNFGYVSHSNQIVYVSLYAVYEFLDVSGNNFYSVSQVSVTIPALPAADLPPVVTGINYTVYDPSHNQNMIVSWSAPLNENIPAFNVASYDVYVAKNTDASGNYVLAGNVLATNTLSYNLDVSNLIHYPCGTTVYFKIQALLVDGSTSPLSDTTDLSHLNIFYYATAPLNLLVSNTQYDASTNLVTMDISFNTPANNGCGAPTQFAIVVTSADGSPTITENIIYDASFSSYLFPFSGVVYQTGTVEVYLITTDTNPSVPGGALYPDRNGASAQTPYVAINFELNPVDYQVYVEPVGTQEMDLSWNVPVTGDWSVVGYDVQFEVDGSGIWQAAPSGTGITGTSYTFDSSSYDCGTTLTFRVIVNLSNGISYSVISNEQSINIFKFATAPQNVNVLWASADASFNVMDIRMTFQNPVSNGCGSNPYFVVNVLDVSNNILDSQTVNYVSGSNTYVVNFNDVGVPIPNYGNVEVYMVTTDTNSIDLENGASQVAPYVAGRLPIYLDVSMNIARTLLTFRVITQTPLVLVNGAITGVSTPTPTIIPYPWYSDGSTPGVSVTQATLDNGELEYTVQMSTPDFTGNATFPDPFGLIVANTGVGIQEYSVDA